MYFFVVVYFVSFKIKLTCIIKFIIEFSFICVNKRTLLIFCLMNLKMIKPHLHTHLRICSCFIELASAENDCPEKDCHHLHHCHIECMYCIVVYFVSYHHFIMLQLQQIRVHCDKIFIINTTKHTCLFVFISVSE